MQIYVYRLLTSRCTKTEFTPYICFFHCIQSSRIHSISVISQLTTQFPISQRRQIVWNSNFCQIKSLFMSRNSKRFNLEIGRKTRHYGIESNREDALMCGMSVGQTLYSPYRECVHSLTGVGGRIFDNTFRP